MSYYSYTNTYSNPAITYYINNPTQGGAVVPPSGGYPISIAGRNYMIDTSFEPYRREAFRHKSLQPQRQSLHFTNIPDDGTVSTEGLWRREARDWSLGSGQIYFDRKSSRDARYYHSKGINPWTQWLAKLHQDTKQVYPKSGTAGSANSVVAKRIGTYVYIIDGNTLKFTADWSTITTVTLETGVTTLYDFCTDGSFVYYVANNGIYKIAIGATSGASKFVAPPTSSDFTAYSSASTAPPLDAIMDFVGGRLILAWNNLKNGWGAATVYGTLAAAISSTTATSISVNVNNTLPPLPFYIRIDSEDMQVVAVDQGQTTFTVVRGVNSTTAANHSTVGTSITSASDVTSIAGACLFDLSYHTPGAQLANGFGNEFFYVHPSYNWQWTGVTAGSSNIYFAGHNYFYNSSSSAVPQTDPGVVFRSTVTQTNSITNGATAGDLTYPVQALPLPSGEYPTAIKGYLNFIFVGTNKGIRMCQTINAYDPTGGSGDLKSGPLLPTINEQPSLPVSAIVGNDRYIYWAWNNYDTESSGLGRLDLTQFIDDLAPAYASDLMIDGYGTTTSGAMVYLDWDPINNLPLMSMNSFVKQATNLTANILEYGLLGTAINSTTATTINVTNENNMTYPATPFNICISNTTSSAWEQMQVTAISGTTWTVTRGTNNTTATTHSYQANVYANTVTVVGHNQFVAGDIVQLENFSNGAYNTQSSAPATILSANSSLFKISTLKLGQTIGNESGESEIIQGNSLPGTTGLGYEYQATGGYARINNSSGVVTPLNYVFVGDPNSCVPSGMIDSGLITYGIPDYKNAVTLDFNINNTIGIYNNSYVDFQLSTDGGSNIDLGTYTGVNRKASFSFNQQFGEEYELYTTITAAKGLNTAGATVNTSPTLARWTLKALPGIPSGTQISAVVLLYEPVEVNGQVTYLDPYNEYAFLEQLRQSQQIVTYVEGPYTAQVTVDVIDWLPERLRDIKSGGYHGDMVVYMKTIAG
jgi:hypothetical protein